MRWVRVASAAGPKYGFVEGDQVTLVEGSPFGDWQPTDELLNLDAAELLVPCVPPTVYAVGVNYEAHARWAAEWTGREFAGTPRDPQIGYRASNALIAHGQPIVLPPDNSGEVHYEAEVVAVLGTVARSMTAANALDCVLGYTIGNDVSDRGWQRSDRTLWRAKNTDTFKPLGPWIDTDIALDDLEVVVWIDGTEVSRFAVAGMVHSLTDYLVAITRYITLVPGDVIYLGTDGATLPALAPGNVVEIEVPGLGVLANPVELGTVA